ncbi:hypothetical protein IWQ60_006599 [Tieghemiomyces parasiticus]|uniref:LITAF domain-containing protein n=1 Tax=Tieghemiomyces parasiticus TaxID=78921 RepID=A0A9W8DH43_9FUNG|nr:hypothetical protein IWQ60_011623 [Tieghemiomyces parasiticus]KAJ1922117.1 hypothetical protein IWQ60_006599 [Tieghemiomyces parasiticus]
MSGITAPAGFILKDAPVTIICPRCQAPVQSVIGRRNGAKAMKAALITSIVFFPLAWVPLCTKSCQDEVHICPQCCHELGRIPA